ncbi:hypothetical protein [Pseudomonas sp. ML96]|uniref:hypothetical protein n=1 Tax=Pseudomonas sp. ML96 TaxID=1523503 RepID=UPI0005B84373|nr:hypothetical protein [Pseudomonas sp. ML96]
MPQGFLTRAGGRIKQAFAIVTSLGSADAGKIPALNAAGVLDNSFLPAGIGANQVVAPTSENLSAGDFVNLFDDGGTLTARKADNSNGREAWGYVEVAVTSPNDATVKRLNTVNGNRTGLTPGAQYWLGTSGGVISAPLDSTDVANANKVCQYLGRADSATELATVEEAPVIL